MALCTCAAAAAAAAAARSLQTVLETVLLLVIFLCDGSAWVPKGSRSQKHQGVHSSGLQHARTPIVTGVYGTVR